MINDKFVYQLFSNILQKDAVIQGRFFRLNSAAELNTSDFNQITYDPLGGISIPNPKYPAAFILNLKGTTPPFQAIRGWNVLNVTMFFLTYKDKADPTQRNANLNISNTVPMDDTVQMESCAQDFWAVLNEVTINNLVQWYDPNRNVNETSPLMNWIRCKSDVPQNINPITYRQNDNLNGAIFNFPIEVNAGYTAFYLSNYTQEGIDAIEIPTGFIPQQP